MSSQFAVRYLRPFRMRSAEPFQLFRYLDEQAFRYNERKHSDGDKGRFMTAMQGIAGKRLTYKKLIDLDGSGLLPPDSTGAWQTA